MPSEGTRTRIGSLWVWEPLTVCELIVVASVFWNGEEWWVGTLTPREWKQPLSFRQRPILNDLSRFYEACVRVNNIVLPGDPSPAPDFIEAVPDAR